MNHSEFSKTKVTRTLNEDGSFEFKYTLEKSGVDIVLRETEKKGAGSSVETNLDQASLAIVINSYLEDAKTFPEITRRIVFINHLIASIAEVLTHEKTMGLFAEIISREKGKK